MYVSQIFKRYKLDIRDGKIFDPIRKKYVAFTPEEKVRQQTIKFLIQRMRVPVNKIGVEKSLDALGVERNRKRVDICIFGCDHEVIAVIECKGYYIDCYDEAPYHQAFDYVDSLNVHNYFVVDGWEMKGYHYDVLRDQFDVLEDMPAYDEMAKEK